MFRERETQRSRHCVLDWKGFSLFSVSENVGIRLSMMVSAIRQQALGSKFRGKSRAQDAQLTGSVLVFCIHKRHLLGRFS
jgi:hypothetical protein